ncbi:hypothetical protein QQS21_009438 [Conoideocrella luteorostrata]|uniref:Zn(2)-C6 fungal-type domain-containing protein n=1 Tax=Conoideocrella luteorostrata TaxID=1105319 RepID=A0AAJ0FQB3_9HYPO|nr:hypothetical protein QQS21_009438 [Conoideocrella luteorostrata]
MGSAEHPKSPNTVLKRSFSTPDTAQLQRNAAEESQSQQTSAGEKKRNKLGYHRTSIACSHCRRRKIRCIASPDVPNRCVNCIRLKKECSFYPVDQQPGPDSRSKVPSRHAGDPSASSTSSSPAFGTGSPTKTPPAGSRNVIPAAGSQRSKAERFPSDASVSPNGISTGIQYTFTNPPTGWVSTDMSLAGVSKSEDVTVPWHAYPNESPMGGQFSPYAQTPSASATWTSGTSEAGSQDEMTWGEFPTPMRSMSYSGESGESHSQRSYMPISQAQPYERRQSHLSDMYPPFPTSMSTVPAHPMAAVSTPAQGMHGMPFASDVNPWQQQMLATQGQPSAWQYGGVPDGNQPMLADEQRATPRVTQAPSGVYYSN